MSALRTALNITSFALRAVWYLILLGYLAVMATIYLMRVSFVAFWVVLALSYAFLPSAWTLMFWQSAYDVYTHSALFKAATLTSFGLLCLPILAVWPGPPPTKTQRELIDEAHMSAVFSQQLEKRRAKFKGPPGELDGRLPSYWEL